MLQNAQRLVDRTRRYLQDPAGTQQGSSFSDADVIDLLNEEQDDMIAEMVQGNEDYFATQADTAFSANVNMYPLFDGCLFLRKLVYLGGTGASVVGPSDMLESRLTEGVNDTQQAVMPDEVQYYYSVYGDNVNVSPTPGQDLVAAMRQFGIRDPGPIVLEIPASIVDASNIRLSSVDAPVEDHIYEGTHFHVVAGTGVGQRRLCTAYVGATKQVTFDSPLSPAPDGTSKFASESRIVRLFHQLLAVGAAMRGKTILEENVAALGAIYAKSRENFHDFIYHQRTGGQRSIAAADYDLY